MFLEQIDIVLTDDIDEIVEFFFCKLIFEVLRQVTLYVFDRKAIVLSIEDEVFFKCSHILIRY